MLSMYGIEWNCHHRNWNWSRIAFIGIGIGIELPFGLGTGFGIGVELPVSELELELNCKNGIDPSSGVIVFTGDLHMYILPVMGCVMVRR